MCKPSHFVASAALAWFAATAVAQTSGALDVRTTMQQQVNPAASAIWDAGNNAMNDEGGLDPVKLDKAKWQALETMAGELASAGRAMAGAAELVAASPGKDIVAEGEVPMADIQRHLEADPAGFRRMATELADHADRLAAAARDQDAPLTESLIGGMDAVCGSCHSQYWSPE